MLSRIKIYNFEIFQKCRYLTFASLNFCASFEGLILFLSVTINSSKILQKWSAVGIVELRT